jgi:serine/threonine protein kinase
MLYSGVRPMPGFILLGKLGEGAFGEVWDANDPSGEPVALKFVDARSKPAAMIRSEIRVLRSLGELRHPNIIELRTVYASSHYIILCMERADGNLEDLRLTYQEEARINIPPDHALEIMEQLAVGLDFLGGVKFPGINMESRGFQHCDIKPSNLLLVGDTVKIADFGLAAASGWQTHRIGCRGTPPYAAPELYRGQPVPGTDQYALAVTYVKMVYGDRVFFPFDKAALQATRPVDLTKLPDREVPAISRALHPEPLGRWPSCQAFVAALRQAVVPSRHRRSSLVRKVPPIMPPPSRTV